MTTGVVEAGAAIICRAGNCNDLDAVARIWLEGWQSNGIALAEEPTYDVLRLRIEREIAPGGWQIIVADQGGALMGFVAMSPNAQLLEQIFVAPAFHRQGVGALLLEAARRAMPQGFTLWTHGANTRAAKFYETMGMTLVGPGVHPKQGHPILTYAFGPLVR